YSHPLTPYSGIMTLTITRVVAEDALLDRSDVKAAHRVRPVFHIGLASSTAYIVKPFTESLASLPQRAKIWSKTFPHTESLCAATCAIGDSTKPLVSPDWQRTHGVRWLQ